MQGLHFNKSRDFKCKICQKKHNSKLQLWNGYCNKCIKRVIHADENENTDVLLKFDKGKQVSADTYASQRHIKQGQQMYTPHSVHLSIIVIASILATIALFSAITV